MPGAAGGRALHMRDLSWLQRWVYLVHGGMHVSLLRSRRVQKSCGGQTVKPVYVKSELGLGLGLLRADYNRKYVQNIMDMGSGEH